TALEKMSDAVLSSDVALFDPPPAVAFRLYNRKGNTGHKWFSAPNPPYGGVIDYYLKARAEGPVRVTISDKSGKVVRELTGTRDAGIHRLVWDLRIGAPAQGGGPGFGGGRGGGRGAGGGGGGGGQRAAAGQQPPPETPPAGAEPGAAAQESAPQLGGGGGGGGFFGGGGRGPRV